MVLGAMDFNAGAVALLVASAIAAVIFAVFFVVRWTMSFPDLPTAGPGDVGARSRASRPSPTSS